MLSVAFWNLKKLARAEMVGKIARQFSTDIVVLAECEETDEMMLRSLSDSTKRTFRNVDELSGKVRIYSSLPTNAVRPVEDGIAGRFSIQRVVLAKTDFLLVAVHLQSKVNRNEVDQLQFAQSMSMRIRRAEALFNHQRTVLVGDLNMNPFDVGMVAAHGLHGVMTRVIASERTRLLDSEDHPFFYNPMWGLMGDRTPGPSGTHYCRLGKPTEYFWNTFDQMLIRPDLLYAFQDDLEILTAVEGMDLLSKKGLPNESVGSDHLPLVFRLNLE